MKILIVDRAKAEIEKLQHFVNLAESYQPITIQQMAIYEYAYLGSLKKVAENLNDSGCRIEGRKVKPTDIADFIKGRPKDALHTFLKRSYTVKANASLKR